MKNKKIEFEKLKNKLKNLFFKRLIQVVNSNNSINLVKNEENTNIDEKSSDPVIANSKAKPVLIIKNVKNESFIPQNIEKITKLSNFSSFSNNTKEKSPIKLISKKISNKKFDIFDKNNEKFKLNTINLESTKLDKQKIDYIKNKDNKSRNISNKSFEIFKNFNIKLISKPNDIKNLNIENVYNQDFEIDEKKITIPSKSQLKNLKENIKLNKADINKTNTTKLKTNSKQLNKSNITKIQNNISYNKRNNLISTTKNVNKNFSINFSKFNPTTVEKNKIIYALPAYQEGTGGPTTTESIGKIHKGEVILSKKESQSFSEKLMKNVPNTNLAINKPQISGEEKYSELEVTPSDPYNPDKPIIPISESIRSEVTAKAQAKETNEIYKPDLLIKEKIDSPLFINSVIKKQSPPSWRTTVG